MTILIVELFAEAWYHNIHLASGAMESAAHIHLNY
jgi:hypothetical protein